MEEIFSKLISESILYIIPAIGAFICKWIWEHSQSIKEDIKHKHLKAFYIMVEEEVLQGSQMLKNKYRELSADGEIDKADKIILQATVKEEVVQSVKDLIAKLPKFVKDSVFGKAEEEIHKAASRIVESKVREQKVKLPVNLK